MSYATDLVRQILLDEAEEMKLQLTSEAQQRNITAIERHKSPQSMNEGELIAYVNLLKRSLPK